MSNINIKIKRLDSTLPLPEYKTSGAAAFDLRASLRDTKLIEYWKGVPLDDRIVYLHPGEVVRIPIGFAFEFPPFWVGLMCPRSGFALEGVSIVNTPSVIDGDFRGEVSVVLIHHGVPDQVVLIHHGDRISQMVMLQTVRASFEEVAELSSTDRGIGGFGSTGVK